MIMRRYYHIIPLLYVFISFLIGPRAAIAGNVDWQLRCNDNGVLQEEIHIPGQDFKTADPDWTINQEGDAYTLRREVKNWVKYSELKDRLPLHIYQKNYLIGDITKIAVDNDDNKIEAGLFQQLGKGENVRVTITVPGVITSVSGERIDESGARWSSFSQTERLQGRKIMTFIMVDGLILGIGIFLLGLLLIMIRFINHLKKAEQIIDEEYSAAKMKKQDEETRGS